MSDTLIIIPTYNEIDNVEEILRVVFSLEKLYHVLIVDDGSPDGTADAVKKLQTEFPSQLHIEERTGKLGLGTAYIHGFQWALKRDYKYIIEMDADFSHPPNSIIELYNACEKDGADVSVGSRYVSGVNVVNWPMSRVLMSYFASVYVRWVTRLPVRDTTAGFVCYNRSVLERMRLDKINFVGYAFQIEMKFTAWRLGFKIKEVPIIFTDRKKGQSKMSSSIFKEAVLGVLFMKIKSWFKKY
ncbi:MAG: dolichyl-phosphate beta-D-mannosyltransferase [Flavobacteriales bacterium]|nr:dolichyl-phosphate beta-D-mannosyltransferase [Flavobacteriales bacterium]MBO73262.1 dolichyl-phosphate beta-D-mannosyltransferase [Flavobacteriales bacterium]|tara:strand:+ start:716 stop:1441 length:726 start_codon:yes stop_codon:yes gene_type:complete